MKMLLLVLFSFNVSAEIVCVNRKCTDVNVEEGKSLLNFDDDQREAIAPVADKPENKNFNNPENQNHYSQMKFREVVEGMCLINTKDKTMYKVIKVNRADKQVKFVAEAEVHNYTLKVNTIMFNFPEAKAFKSLQKWDCNRTANLGDNGYIKKCIGKASFGEQPCDPPRMFK